MSVPENRIEIKPLKSGLVKKYVYASGHLQTIYTGCPNPVELSFRSPMVNDDNQDLCGGWRRSDIVDEEQLILTRVLEGKKPLGNLSSWGKLAVEIPEEKKEVAFRRFTRTFNNSKTSVDCLDVCRRGTLGELFDLESLATDYGRFLPHFKLGEEIQKSASIEMQSFLGDKWDNHFWLTGLILGYPIENTMSRYYRNVKRRHCAGTK
jgi:hypothetical protein